MYFITSIVVCIKHVINIIFISNIYVKYLKTKLSLYIHDKSNNKNKIWSHIERIKIIINILMI